MSSRKWLKANPIASLGLAARVIDKRTSLTVSGQGSRVRPVPQPSFSRSRLWPNDARAGPLAACRSPPGRVRRPAFQNAPARNPDRRDRPHREINAATDPNQISGDALRGCKHQLTNMWDGALEFAGSLDPPPGQLAVRRHGPPETATWPLSGLEPCYYLCSGYSRSPKSRRGGPMVFVEAHRRKQ